jgi:tRNA pseudouridine38-40 synthase
MKIALGVEYDGRAFHGWQRQQAGVRTVQLELEAGLSRVAAHPVTVVCAGRTDAGVHGVGQVVHFETPAQRSPHNWLLGANANLPDDVNVLWVRVVPDDFHARFSATGRAYHYLILNRQARSSLLAGRATWVHRPLDAARMHRAGQALLGRHDFSSYRALACQATSPVRTLRSLSVTRRGDLLELAVSADAFLHHMVRNIAGVLLTIGRGDAPETWAQEVLELRDRTLGGVTAAPEGLYLAAVDYPERFDLPRSPGFALPL